MATKLHKVVDKSAKNPQQVTFDISTLNSFTVLFDKNKTDLITNLVLRLTIESRHGLCLIIILGGQD